DGGEPREHSCCRGDREAGSGRGWAAIERSRLHSLRHHFNPVRYAATALACSSVRPRSGIFAPGLSRCGSCTHAATLSDVFGHMPGASAARPPKWLRFGPSTPDETPAIVWQLTHALFVKMALPSAARPLGSTGSAFWRIAQASNSAAGSVITRMPMLA